MTSLGLVGIADKGTYNQDTTYNRGQFVLYNGSTWLALKDNLTGVEPTEGENWKYLARGFAAELLSLVTAIDSQGLSGSQGGQVNAQSLIDVLADKVANQLIAKSMMSNVQVNDAEKVPTSALAYAMQQSIETLNSNTSFEFTASNEVSIINNKSVKVGRVVYVAVKIKIESKLTTDSILNFADIAKNQSTTFLIGKGSEWNIDSVVYGYISGNSILINNSQETISVGDFLHINTVLIL